jgi:hypothetical protein
MELLQDQQEDLPGKLEPLINRQEDLHIHLHQDRPESKHRLHKIEQQEELGFGCSHCYQQ